jgi:replicative DNA helicase
MATPDKTVPHNIEAEEAVLGALLIDPEGIFRVLSFLRSEDFYLQKHRWIFETILKIHERRDPIDFLTINTELENRAQLKAVGGAAYISKLMNAVPSAINIESYGRMVEETAVRRRLLDSVSDIARYAYNETMPIDQVVDRSEQALFGVSQRRTRRELQPVQEVVQRYYDRIEYLYEHRGEPLGVPSGFRDIDQMLGGFQRSDLLILAARPGVGKTSLMITFALKAAQKRRTVALFSLEMSAEQLVQRMISQISHIDAQRLRLGRLRDDEWPQFTDAIGHLAELPIYIDDTPSISVPTAHQMPAVGLGAQLGYGLRRLPPTYDDRGALGQPRPGGLLHLPVAQGPGARVGSAADDGLAAFPRRRAARRKNPRALGSTRKWVPDGRHTGATI